MAHTPVVSTKVECLSTEGCKRVPVEKDSFRVAAIRNALAALEELQAWFRHTGGTHGAWLRDTPPASDDGFVVVSSRASFELVRKTVRAGFSMIVAIGAATSLAIETDDELIIEAPKTRAAGLASVRSTFAHMHKHGHSKPPRLEVFPTLQHR